jgi:antirestriction protein
MTTTQTITPRIYVACLAAYNSGYLHGEWIDVDSEEQVWGDIKKILKTSPIPDAEEWAIHDHEYLGMVSEYECIDKLVVYAEFIREHGELGIALLEHFNNNIEDAIIALEDNYHGEYDDQQDFVIRLTEETGGEIPKHLQFYIDYAAMARDYFMCDFYDIEVGNSIHVFSNH